MRSDPLSPFAPARVRALVLPLGKIKRSRFLQFYKHLTLANVVKVKDLPIDEEGFSSMCSLLIHGSPIWVANPLG
jgi:hypothetical protein